MYIYKVKTFFKDKCEEYRYAGIVSGSYNEALETIQEMVFSNESILFVSLEDIGDAMDVEGLIDVERECQSFEAEKD